MKSKLIHKLLLFILLVSVASFVGTNKNIVQAEDTTEYGKFDTTVSTDYAVADYSGAIVKNYIGKEAPTVEGYLFAGWFTGTECTWQQSVKKSSAVNESDVYYAKFVPENILDVKAQVSTQDVNTSVTGDQRNMRFVSSVDTLNYSKIGFTLTYEENGVLVPKTNESDTVFQRIESATLGDEYEFSPKVVSTKSEYFMTATWKGTDNKGIVNFETGFYVRAYWITADGVQVFGESRYVTVNEGVDKSIINMPIKNSSVSKGDSLTISTGEGESKKDYTGTVTYTDGIYAHVNFDLGETERTSLASATAFTILNASSETIATEIYRNFYREFSGEADRSWYDVDTNQEEFVIATTGDLYGLADIVNDKTDNFYEQRIYLVNDISVNSGTVAEWKNMTDTEKESLIDWTPIGNSTLNFNGTFNGQGHTISGLYAVGGATQTGLFGITQTSTTVCELIIRNSYFTNSTYGLGSFVGHANGGTYDTLYSEEDVLVESNSTQIGGIIGRLNKTNGTYTVNNCWFAGEVTANGTTASNVYCGGIVGCLVQGTLNISNCLNSGKVTYIYSTTSTNKLMVGGICGGTMNDTAFLNMSDSFNTGTVTAKDTDGTENVTGVKGLLGYGNQCNTQDEKVQWSFQDCYVEQDDGNSGYYQVADSSELSKTNVSLVSKSNNSITGYQSYKSTLSNLGLYSNSKEYAENERDYWVVNVDGMPTLKDFTDSWIDVGWYYDNKNTGEYVIETAEELYGFSEISQDNSFSGATVKLGDDIKANNGDAGNWKAGTMSAKRQWKPIGKDTTFAGHFDGNNHTIKGIYVSETSDEAGLFAYATGTIQNLILENSYIKNTKQQTAAVVGNFEGSLVNGVYCKDNVYVVGSGNGTGGIIGRYAANATVSKCWFAGQVENSERYTGGIVGRISGGTKLTIQNCLNTGDIESTFSGIAYVGGVLGGEAKTIACVIENCLNTGSVTAKNATGGAGSVIGFYCSLDIDDVYTFSTSVSGIEGAVAGCGNVATTASASGQAIIVTDIDGTDAYKYMELDFYSNDNKNGVWVAIEDAQPELAQFSTKTATKSFAGVQKEDVSWYHNATSFSGRAFGTQKTTVFNIADSGDLFGLASLVNNGKEDFAGKEVHMTADVEVNAADVWQASTKTVADINFTPIGTADYPFNGTFDGSTADGLYTISGIYIKPTSTYAGLFGYAASESQIQNFKLTNTYINSTKSYTGSVAGWLEGDLEGVYSEAILNSTAQSCGGMVGQFAGAGTTSSITNCWFDGELTSSNQYSGGIVGRVRHGDKTISNCLNTADIINTYTNTTASKNIAFSGGLIGAAANAEVTSLTIKQCLNTGKLSVANVNAGGTVIGRANSIGQVTFQDVYTTDELLEGSATPSITTGYYGIGNYSNSTKVGFPYLKTTTDISGADGYNNTSLDFYFSEEDDGYWVATEGTPVLKQFIDESTWNSITSGFDACRVNKEWYTKAPSTATTFTIFSAADLYGLAELVNTDQNTFAEETDATDIVIELGDDIVVNEGKATDWAKGVNLTNVDEWTPIGKKELSFKGTFEGNDKTISGIYVDTDASYAGLFGYTAAGCNIQNVRLVNSYYRSSATNAYMGSVVGQGAGTLDGIYSDAILVSSGIQVGGLVGRVNDESLSTNVTFESANAWIKNSWFDGSIELDNTRYAGGIVGALIRGRLEISNCLNTGEISSDYTANHPYVAGFCSTIINGAQLDIINALSAGHITTARIGSVASVVGRVTGNENMGSTLTLTNVFATKECYGYTVGGVQSEITDEETGAITTYGGVQNGVVVQTSENDRLVGYCTEETGATLDYDNTWAMVSEGTPILQKFADMVDTGVSVLDEEGLAALETELYLDYWNDYYTGEGELSLSKFVDYGVGNYALSFDTNDASAEKKVYEDYAASLVNDYGFTLHASNDLDGVYNAIYTKDNWVLNIIYAGGNLGKTTLVVSTGGPESLSPNLVYNTNTEADDYEDTNYQKMGEMQLTMLQATTPEKVEALGIETELYQYGNSFVFHLPNGHFIINDGGNKDDLAGLVTYLQGVVGKTDDVQNPVYIDAWTISHQHNDHTGLFKQVVDTPSSVEGIYVKAFYLSEPNTNTLQAGGLISDVQKQYVGMNLFEKDENGGKPSIYYMQTGQRYYFNGLTMDVIQGQEQIPFSSYANTSATNDSSDFNTASEILLFTTANGHKTMIGGDANYVNMQYIMDAYGKDDNGYTASSTLQGINVLVAFHHGKNMSMTLSGTVDYSFIDYLTADGTDEGHMFDYVLYPCSKIYGVESLTDVANAFPNAEEANTYLNGKTENKSDYGDGNVTVTIQN